MKKKCVNPPKSSTLLCCFYIFQGSDFSSVSETEDTAMAKEIVRNDDVIMQW